MMEGWKLPAGWDFATLSEPKVRILSGFSCARKNVVSEGLLHLRPFNIGINGEIDLSNCLYIPEGFVNNPTDFWLESGDILFNNTNSVELVGKSAIVRTNLPCAFSNHLTRIRVIDRDYLEPQWILVFLRYLWQTGFFAAHCNRWIGQAGYAPSKLTELSLPRPPIAEQRRIVARLEALLDEVKALREQVQTMWRDVNRLMESALAEVFPAAGQPLPQGWDSATLSEPRAQILSGFSCARKNVVSQGLLHLRPFNIGINGEIDLSNCLYIPEDFVNNPIDFWLENGDILFNNTNSVELVGKSAIVRTNLPCAFSNHLTRIRIIDKDYFEPHWILFFLRYLWQTGFFAANCNRWIGQAGYAPSKLTELSIPRPPITEQRRIVAYLDGIQQTVREAQELIQADLRAIEQLEQSILAAAFRGEI